MSEIVETPLSAGESESRDHLLPRDNGDELVSPDSLSNFHFKLPVFEGPLDLLLHLIKEQKIDIYDIPIVQITHQYMEYLELMKELNLEIAGEFLVMAATLIHIKSKMLLPPDEEETEESAEDPRAELVQRLLEYQAYKESSSYLRKREEIWKNIFYRNTLDEELPELEPEPLLIEANVFDLISAFKKVLEKAPEQVIEITRETLTVTDRINYIVEKLENEDAVRFEEFFEEGYTRLTLIVTFIALLELVRLGLVKIYQEKAFGQIWVLNPRQQTSKKASEETESVDSEKVLA
jgi:segregation and condensation protein A